jgi:hypothetical protein
VLIQTTLGSQLVRTCYIPFKTRTRNYGHPDIGKKEKPERGKNNGRRRTEKEETGRKKQDTMKEEEELGMKIGRRGKERVRKMQMKIKRRNREKEAVGRGEGGNEEMKTKERKRDSRKIRRE